MPNRHCAHQARVTFDNVVHLFVNLKCEKVNTGAFKKFVQLEMGICEPYFVDLNDFFYSPLTLGLTV